MQQTDRIRQIAVTDPANRRVYHALLQSWWEADQPAAARQGLRQFVLTPDDPRVVRNVLVSLKSTGRAGDIPTWLPRGQGEVEAPQRHDVELPPLVDLYERLLAETDRRRSEGWSPSSIEAPKFTIPLTVEHLTRFRRSEVSSGTQTVPERPSSFGSLDFSSMYPDVTEAELDEWRPILSSVRGGMLHRLYAAAAADPQDQALRGALDFCDALALDDDRFGARLFEAPGLGPVTAKSLQSTFYACRLYALTPKNGSVLEIGGGFGAVASRLLRIRPDVIYMLTDLPVNMVLTYAYLRSHFGDKVYGAFEGPIRPPKGTRVMIIPPWRLGEMTGRASVVFNTMSFQHMDARNHRYYGDVMRHFRARRLYHVNREIVAPGDRTVHIPASRYSFHDQFDIISRSPFDERWVEIVADRKDEAGHDDG